MDEAQSILAFWFGAAPEAGIAEPLLAARWYKKDLAFDRSIRERFLETYLGVLRREHESWREDPFSCLAYVICLDQFSRNMFRDTPLAFASDPAALRAAREAIVRGHDRAVRGDMRAFFYLPLMHAEDLRAQEQCVSCFESLCEESEGDLKQRFENNLDFARRHRDIVARFGRFPHRNEVLGRPSTAQEVAFLAQPGSSF